MKLSGSIHIASQHDVFNIDRSQALSVLFDLQEHFLKKYDNHCVVKAYSLLDDNKSNALIFTPSGAKSLYYYRIALRSNSKNGRLHGKNGRDAGSQKSF